MTVKGVANHFELHVARPDVTLPWYKDLLSYFEWNVVAEWPGSLGMTDGNVNLWFMGTPEDHRRHEFDRDATGLSHVGIHVESKDAVDTFVTEYMQPKSIAPEFGTPRPREEFRPTYYQVMFIDPEGLAVEVFTS